MLHRMIEAVLPGVIASIELIGIFIVAVGAFRAFYYYLSSLVGKCHQDFKHLLLEAMETGLEFKMAAEILKTVLIREVSELVILGAVILLRALLAFMIHIEMRTARQKGPS
ncbi:MAG: DUF1622 domain-containing protein [Oscillospiraceae bacterium]